MKRIIFFITFFIYSGYYAVLTLIISLGYIQYSRYFTIPIRMLTSFLMFYLILKNFRTTKSNKEKVLFILFVLFWVFYFAKILFLHSSSAPMMRNWIEYIFYGLNFCVLPFLTFRSIEFRDYKNTIIWALIVSGFCLAIISSYFYFGALLSGVGRINMLTYETGEETINPLALSYSSVLTIFLCIYVLIFTYPKGKIKVFVSSTILISFIPFLLGSSRGSVIAAILSALAFFLFSDRFLRTRISFIFISIVIMSIIASNYSNSSVYQRSSEISVNSESDLRLVYWRLALNEFAVKPIFGGNIELVNAPGVKNNGTIKNAYPHNVIIEVMLSTGMFGFVLFFLILSYSVIKLFKIVRLDNTYLWVLVIFIQGFTQGMFSGALYFSVLIFFSLGIIASLKINSL